MEHQHFGDYLVMQGQEQRSWGYISYTSKYLDSKTSTQNGLCFDTPEVLSLKHSM